MDRKGTFSLNGQMLYDYNNCSTDVVVCNGFVPMHQCSLVYDSFGQSAVHFAHIIIIRTLVFLLALSKVDITKSKHDLNGFSNTTAAVKHMTILMQLNE